jgi:hypothetical protein
MQMQQQLQLSQPGFDDNKSYPCEELQFAQEEDTMERQLLRYVTIYYGCLSLVLRVGQVLRQPLHSCAT